MSISDGIDLFFDTAKGEDDFIFAVIADSNPSTDTLILGIPTDEAVEWCSYIVFRKDNLNIGENDSEH